MLLQLKEVCGHLYIHSSFKVQCISMGCSVLGRLEVILNVFHFQKYIFYELVVLKV